MRWSGSRRCCSGPMRRSSKSAGKDNWKALHLVSLSWALATMAGLYAIGKQPFDRETGLVAALFYSVFQPWAAYKNLAFNGEIVMNLPIVWAWAIGLNGVHRNGDQSY